MQIRGKLVTARFQEVKTIEYFDEMVAESDKTLGCYGKICMTS